MQMDTAADIGLPSGIGNPGTPRSGIVIHYIGGSAVPRGTHDQCRSQVRGWHQYHRSLGWQGIGYSVLLCYHGIVMTGRGINRVGSHAPGANSTHIGICFMLGGNQAPTKAQLKGYRDLLTWLGTKGVNTKNVSPHSRWISTSCPGDHMRSRISTGNWGTGGTVSPVPGNGSGSAGTAGGMTSVRSILNQQKAVNGMGYSPRLAEDGIWGPKTDTGIRWAQSRIGVKVDGLWGTDTEKAYQRYLDKSGTGITVLRKGHTGIRVRQLQQALMKAGEKLPKYRDDGSFGTETQEALKSFQRKAKLSADGEYGPRSAAALRKRLG